MKFGFLLGKVADYEYEIKIWQSTMLSELGAPKIKIEIFICFKYQENWFPW
jgi:hypothetical protein